MQLVTDIPGLPVPIAHGRQNYGGGPDTDGWDGSGRSWMLFPRLTEKQLSAVCNVYFIERRAMRAGQHFSGPFAVIQTKRRTLITQFSGRDI